MADKLMEFAKVKHRDGGSFVCERDEVSDFIDDAFDPEEYTTEIIRMTRAQFEALPEFPGF